MYQGGHTQLRGWFILMVDLYSGSGGLWVGYLLQGLYDPPYGTYTCQGSLTLCRLLCLSLHHRAAMAEVVFQAI